MAWNLFVIDKNTCSYLSICKLYVSNSDIRNKHTHKGMKQH